MSNQFFNVSHSPIVNAIRKSAKSRKFHGLALALTLASTTAITTGVIPVTVAGVSSQKQASACGYTKWNWAWWGVYIYHDRCAARDKGYNLLREANGSAAGAYLPNPYLQAAGLTWTFTRGVAGQQMLYCANKSGQAYLRIPYVMVGGGIQVSCW